MRTSPAALLCATLMVLWAPFSSAQTTIRETVLDSTNGQLRIVLSSNHVIEPAKDSGQVGFTQVAIAPDRRVVGWLSLYRDCCTEYPIPLALVLSSAGGQRTVIQNALPIWEWFFTAGGKNVVIRQAPVHGDAPVTYELHEVSTGRLLAAATGDSALPSWTQRRADTTKSAPPPPLSRSAAVELRVSLLRTYVGLYELAPGEELDVTLQNRALYIRSTSGGEAVRLRPESTTEFSVKDAAARVRFTRDRAGKVTGLVIHQFGRDRAARKL